MLSLFFIGVMILYSCSDSSASGITQIQETNDINSLDNPHEPPAYNAVMDSISKLNERISELESRQNISTEDVNVSKKEQSNYKGKTSLLIILPLGIALLATIIAIIAIVKAIKVSNRTDRNWSGIDGLSQKLNNLALKVSSNEASCRTSLYSGISIYDYRDLSERISRVERYLRQNISTVNQMPVGNKTVVDHGQEKDIHRGYFGLPSQMSVTEGYFEKFDEMRDSDSRFSVEIKGEKAKFEPLLENTKLLNGIKSGDVIKFALEFQGCALSDVKQMKVISSGEAIKKDGLWIITKKATIALYR